MVKRISIFVLFLLIVSCEKDYLLPEKEIPQWLIEKIESDEKIISTNSEYYLAYGAWGRYEWKEEFYYEYINGLSSTIPSPISHTGDTLDFLINDSNTDYYKEKCCKEYVWKGSKYQWLY